MADNSGNRDPWGREQGPPDLIAVIKKLLNSAKSQKGGAANPPDPVRRYGGLAIAGLFVLWLLSGIFVVGPPEQAVVLRFGKYVETLGPGPHWIPQLIESRNVINVQEVSTFPYQSEMLTQDENIVSVAVAVQYRIVDPNNFLFGVTGPIETLQQATSSALRQAVGQMTLDAILTTGRQKLRDEVATQLNKILSAYNTGLEVTDMTLQPAKPPEGVTAAFDDAIRAREDEQRYINKAQAYARQQLSLAKGQVARVQQLAAAYKKEVVLQAEGDVARYMALLKPYEEAPGVTRDRLYIDAISNMLQGTNNILVEGNGNNNLLYLPIEQWLKQVKPTAPNDATINEPNNKSVDLPQPQKSDIGADANSIYNNISRPTYPNEGEAP